MKINPIPPLQCLVFFDAAARHGNFTRAAEELNVTQGAVSKQVVKLESYLGMQLFVRDAKALHLTRAGRHMPVGSTICSLAARRPPRLS